MRTLVVLVGAAVLGCGFFLETAGAGEFGACAESFRDLLRKGAKISKIQGIVIDHANRRVTYVLADARVEARFLPGQKELRALHLELDFVGRSWLVEIPGDQQTHYARNEGGWCSHYPLEPPTQPT